MDFADFVTAFAILGPLALVFGGVQAWKRRRDTHWRDKSGRYSFALLSSSALLWIFTVLLCLVFGKKLQGGEPAYLSLPGILWVVRINFLLVLAALALAIVSRVRQIPALLIAAIGLFFYWNIFLFD